MNDLNSLRKEKEKGCGYFYDELYGGIEVRCGSKYKKNHETSGWDKSKERLYCKTCQAEISALKSGISVATKLIEDEIKWLDELQWVIKDTVTPKLVKYVEDRIKYLRGLL